MASDLSLFPLPFRFRGLAGHLHHRADVDDPEGRPNHCCNQRQATRRQEKAVSIWPSAGRKPEIGTSKEKTALYAQWLLNFFNDLETFKIANYDHRPLRVA